MHLTEEQVSLSMESLLAYHQRYLDEVEHYEYLKAGNFPEIHDLKDLGRFLIELRICRGLTQAELAERLEVHPSQVSRDEKNEYHGISKERVAAIVGALLKDVPEVSGLQIAVQIREEHPPLHEVEIVEFPLLQQMVHRQRGRHLEEAFPYNNVGHEQFG